MARMSTLTLPATKTAIACLGFNVKRLRLAYGWTQQHLAGLLAPTRASDDVDSVRVQIARIENGRAPAKSDMDWLDGFSLAFDCDFEELLRKPLL